MDDCHFSYMTISKNNNNNKISGHSVSKKSHKVPNTKYECTFTMAACHESHFLACCWIPSLCDYVIHIN
jgi:hypothetical protein